MRLFSQIYIVRNGGKPVTQAYTFFKNNIAIETVWK